jgi:hypothetical protein
VSTTALSAPPFPLPPPPLPLTEASSRRTGAASALTVSGTSRTSASRLLRSGSVRYVVTSRYRPDRAVLVTSHDIPLAPAARTV